MHEIKLILSRNLIQQRYYAPFPFPDTRLFLETLGNFVCVLSEPVSFWVLSSVGLDTSVTFLFSDNLVSFNPADVGVLPCAVSVETLSLSFVGTDDVLPELLYYEHLKKKCDSKD